MSDNFNGIRFYDSMQKELHGGFLKFLKWQFSRSKPRWPKKIAVKQYDIPPEKVLQNELRVSYVGHVTYLIQTESLNILTDPVWSKRASPINFAGPKRIIDPGIKYEDLPPIDIILVSHNHYDHLDLSTIAKLWRDHKPRIITALGNDAIIKSINPEIKVEAYDWGDQVEINNDVKIHLHPMSHWSARGIFDRNKALWAAFNIETKNGNIYFVGDTGYNDGVHFKTAKAKFGSFRLVLLPIGAYEPRWFMKTAHMNPEEAVKAYMDLGMPYTVPGHFDVFQLTDEPYGEALVKLQEAKDKFGIGENFIPLEVGGNIYVPSL